MTRRKQTLRQAFITTVASAGAVIALTASGCSEVQVQEVCLHGEAGCDEPCPNGAPAHGSFCQQDGQSCYFSGSECSDTLASCNGGVWNVSEQQSSCNPPPPDPTCPETIPQSGTPCESWNGPYQCDGYLDPICGIEVSAYCENGGTWIVDSIACNPPPPDCWSQPDEGSCESQGWCAWLEPSCEANTLPSAGCFPADDCTLVGCFDGGECADLTVHPCPDGDCNSCSIPRAVCLPPNG